MRMGRNRRATGKANVSLEENEKEFMEEIIGVE